MIGAAGSFTLRVTAGATTFFAVAPPDTRVTAPAIWPGIRTAAPAAAATAPDRAMNALLLIGSTHLFLSPRLDRRANNVRWRKPSSGMRSQTWSWMVTVMVLTRVTIVTTRWAIFDRQLWRRLQTGLDG